jgi:hypothetical protein
MFSDSVEKSMSGSIIAGSIPENSRTDKIYGSVRKINNSIENIIASKKIEENSSSHKKIIFQDKNLELMTRKKTNYNRSKRVKSETNTSKTLVHSGTPETPEESKEPHVNNGSQTDTPSITSIEFPNQKPVIDDSQVENLMSVLKGLIEEPKGKEAALNEEETQKKSKGGKKSVKSSKDLSKSRTKDSKDIKKETKKTTSDKLKQMKGLIESFLKQEAERLTKVTSDKLSVDVEDHISKADMINSVIDNHIEHERRHEKRKGL